MKLGWVVSFMILSGCQEDKKTPTPQALQTIAPGFFDFTVPAPSSPVQPVDSAPLSPPAPILIFPDPQSLRHEDQMRARRGLRHGRVLQSLQERAMKGPEPLRLQDPDYQQWPEARFPESRSTLPVDRARILTADMRIPALLEDAVTSQCGGRVIAVVERDVLSPTGRFILIPAYSKLICQYQPLEAIGQQRLTLNCQRLIRPDGISMNLHSSPAADQAGRIGLGGDLDQRLWDRYGAAFIMASLSSLSQGASLMGTPSPQTPPGLFQSVPPSTPWIQGTTQSLANALGQVTAQVMEQHLHLAPILSIPAGTRLHILPTTDIILRHPVKASRSAMTRHP